MTSLFQLGASCEFSQIVLPFTVSASRCSRLFSPSSTNHGRNAAGVVEILHQKASGGHQVDDGLDLAAQLVPVAQGKFNPASSGDRQEMDDRVGRAADRAVHADRVLECLARENLGDAQIFVHHLDDAPARQVSQVQRRASAAGMAALCGRPRPSASTMQAMVEAVPMVMQWPAERDMQTSASRNSAWLIVPARTSSLKRHTSVPEPISRPRNFPFSMGPPETTSVGRSQLAAPMIRAGMVLSQPQSSTTPSIGLARIDSSTSMLTRLRNSMAVGRSVRFAKRRHGEFERKSAGFPDPALDPVGEIAEVRVAGRQLRPGIADPDDRAAIEYVLRIAAHPAAMNEAILVDSTKPRT